MPLVSHCRPESITDTHSNPGCQSNPDPDPDADSDSDANSNPNADPNSVTDS